MNANITINKEWLEKNQKDFIANYDNQTYTEAKDKGKYLLIDLPELENSEYLISDTDKINISSGDDNFYMYIEDKPTINELLNLATIIAKYYNKAKTAIEALK